MLKRILAAVTIIVIGVAGYGFYLRAFFFKAFLMFGGCQNHWIKSHILLGLEKVLASECIPAVQG